MLHGYEEATYVPAMSLYDSGMMLQMVAAARELYLQGLKDLDDFYKTYGDFLSPSLADMNYYYDNTVGSIRDMFNYALAHGIDLLRSAEGRAMVANVRRNIPYAKLAAIRLNAKDLDTYNKLVALEKANGTYMNDEVQAMLNGGFNPKDFSTIGPDGRILMVGTRTPYRIRDLKTVSQPYFDGRTPGELSKEEVESFGIKYDPRYNYTGFTKAQLLNIANGFDTTTPEGKAYFYMARKQVQDAANASGQNLTEDQLNKAARQVLAKQIADANIEYLVKPEKKADQYQYLLAQTAASDWLDRQKTARDLQAQKDLYDYQNDPKNNPKSALPLAYTTLTNTESQRKATQNNNGIDVQDAYNNVVRMMGTIIPYNTPAEKTLWKNNYAKLKGNKKVRYDQYRTVYHKLQDYLSKDPDKKKAAVNWFNLHPGYTQLAFGPKGTVGSDLTKSINKHFGAFEAPINGGYASETASFILGGTEKIQSPWAGKYKKVDLSSGSGIRFSPIAKGNAFGSGSGLYTYNSDERAFDRFLMKNVRKDSWLVDNSFTSASIGNKRYTSGTVTVPYTRFMKPSEGVQKKDKFSPYKQSDQLWSIARLNRIGVQVMTSTGELVDDNMFKHMSYDQQRNLVVKVPVTKTNELGGVQDSEYDAYYRKLIGGASYAKEQQPNDQARMLQTYANTH